MFWPFLLGDIFSYALWPYDYYYPFWSYGTAYDYDYGPYVPAYRYYGYSDLSNIYGYTGTTGSSRNDTHANQIPPEVTQSCGGFAPGVTSFPIDRIRQAIHPTGEQITFLDDLATASSKASAVLNASCPNQPPLTPLARLDAVERRLEATIRAIEIVRPALATLYDSLSDEQRQRLDAIGAEEMGTDAGQRPTVLLAPLASPRFAATKPPTSPDYLCNALRKSLSRRGSNKARWKSSSRHQKMPRTSCARLARRRWRSHLWHG